MRVLVTDSDNRSALAATRSLGRAGYEVLVMGEREASIAAASRYCSRFLACPSPIEMPDAFLGAVLAACRGDHAVIVIAIGIRQRVGLASGPLADDVT